jgi:hypothetical protein
VKDGFYEELECVFDFSAKVGREDILNWQLGMKVYTKSLMIMELQ